VPLKNKVFGEYVFVFSINDSYSITDFSEFRNKHQLFFQRIENKNQQLNLMIVDSFFVNILADLTLEVLLNKLSSFQDYIQSNHKIRIVENLNEVTYLTHKFSDFIYLLLFADISSNKDFNQELFTDRVFCLKNNLGELEYYSIYELKILQTKLLEDMKIEIDYDLSSITKQEAKLCLRFSFKQ
jgi:hypothetical protein